MNFRSIANLNQVIVGSLPRVPRDIDLVVGIPRSGLLAANMLALHLNLPLTDMRGLIQRRLLQSGRRMGDTRSDFFDRVKKVLVVDDSVNSGSAMRRARSELDAAGLDYDLVYSACYVTEASQDLVDLWFEIVPTPRVFEWNVMHQQLLADCCVDIDGVLCRDPRPDENDDGPRYREFLLNVEPLFLPTVRIGALVTARLEKYRSETEEWLGRHGIEFDELVMLDLPDAASRRAAGCHASHKAAAYRRRDSLLFVESDAGQAGEIARTTGRPVLCIGTRRMYYPESVLSDVGQLTRRKLRGLGKRVRRRLRRLLDSGLQRKPAVENAHIADEAHRELQPEVTSQAMRQPVASSSDTSRDDA